ncbi:uncharacterized protein LOC144864859 isoform X1 [Branchiostoma floridae x Branchiostoma japonicum]
MMTNIKMEEPAPNLPMTSPGRPTEFIQTTPRRSSKSPDRIRNISVNYKEMHTIEAEDLPQNVRKASEAYENKVADESGRSAKECKVKPLPQNAFTKFSNDSPSCSPPAMRRSRSPVKIWESTLPPFDAPLYGSAGTRSRSRSRSPTFGRVIDPNQSRGNSRKTSLSSSIASDDVRLIRVASPETPVATGGNERGRSVRKERAVLKEIKVERRKLLIAQEAARIPSLIAPYTGSPDSASDDQGNSKSNQSTPNNHSNTTSPVAQPVAATSPQSKDTSAPDQQRLPKDKEQAKQEQNVPPPKVDQPPPRENLFRRMVRYLSPWRRSSDRQNGSSRRASDKQNTNSNNSNTAKVGGDASQANTPAKDGKKVSSPSNQQGSKSNEKENLKQQSSTGKTRGGSQGGSTGKSSRQKGSSSDRSQSRSPSRGKQGDTPSRTRQVSPPGDQVKVRRDPPVKYRTDPPRHRKQDAAMARRSDPHRSSCEHKSRDRHHGKHAVKPQPPEVNQGDLVNGNVIVDRKPEKERWTWIPKIPDSPAQDWGPALPKSSPSPDLEHECVGRRENLMGSSMESFNSSINDVPMDPTSRYLNICGLSEFWQKTVLDQEDNLAPGQSVSAQDIHMRHKAVETRARAESEENVRCKKGKLRRSPQPEDLKKMSQSAPSLNELKKKAAKYKVELTLSPNASVQDLNENVVLETDTGTIELPKETVLGSQKENRTGEINEMRNRLLVSAISGKDNLADAMMEFRNRTNSYLMAIENSPLGSAGMANREVFFPADKSPKSVTRPQTINNHSIPSIAESNEEETMTPTKPKALDNVKEEETIPDNVPTRENSETTNVTNTRVQKRPSQDEDNPTADLKKRLGHVGKEQCEQLIVEGIVKRLDEKDCGIEDEISAGVIQQLGTEELGKEEAESRVQKSDQESRDGKYYLGVMDLEKDRISKLCGQAEKDQEGEVSEEADGLLRAAVGKAQLLVNQKFKQFEGLCQQNLNPVDGEGDQCLTTSSDLAGFWDLVNIQIEDVNSMFEEIALLRQNEWKFPPPTSSNGKDELSPSSSRGTSTHSTPAASPKPRRTRPKTAGATRSPKAGAKSAARDDARKRLLEAKRAAAAKKKANMQEDNNVEIFLPEASNTTHT